MPAAVYRRVLECRAVAQEIDREHGIPVLQLDLRREWRRQDIEPPDVCHLATTVLAELAHLTLLRSAAERWNWSLMVGNNGALKADEADEMPYERVLVALDVMADAADAVVRRAKRIAPQAEATALHVVDRHAFGVELASFRELADLQELAMKGAAERLDALCKPAGIADCVVVQGNPAREIRRHAVEWSADLVVVGAHGRHGWRLLLGSTANAVLHGVQCDVLCVHIPGVARRSDEILVAVDETESARTVVARAVEVAAVDGGRVSVASVLRPLEYTYAGIDLSPYADAATRLAREADDKAQGRLDDLAAHFGLTGGRFVRHGRPADEIHALTDELAADLVAVGTHGRYGLARLAGSTANAVLHGAKSDVLAVRVGEIPAP